jgi:DinB superfamily
LRRIIPKVAFLLFLPLVSGMAQSEKPAEPHTVSQVVDFWVTNTEQRIVPAADAMPEAKYGFVPSNGEFSGVRTFRDQVKHLAAANYQLAAATLGVEPPAGTDHETAPDSVRTKAETMEYLRGSFSSLHRAASALSESNMDDPIPSKGNRTRLLMLIDALVHSSNHYGQMVEYLRMNNIVPPASR